MNPDDLTRILDEIGQRLGPSGEYVFALAVRQVVIDAVLTIAWVVPFLVLIAAATAWAARFTLWHYREAKAKADQKGSGIYRDRVDISDYVLPWLLGSTLGTMVVGAVTLMLFTQISRLLNPEYAALRDILRAIT